MRVEWQWLIDWYLIMHWLRTGEEKQNQSKVANKLLLNKFTCSNHGKLLLGCITCMQSVDVACCYICHTQHDLCDCLTIGHNYKLCKNGRTYDVVPFGALDRVGPINHVSYEGSRSPTIRGTFEGMTSVFSCKLPTSNLTDWPLMSRLLHRLAAWQRFSLLPS